MGITSSLNKLIHRKAFNKKNTLLSKSSMFLQCSVSTLVGMALGYQYGYRWCDQTDYTPYYLDYQSQEQIINVIQQSNKPVYLFIYMPGNFYTVYYRYEFLKQAKQSHQSCNFIKANLSQQPQAIKNRQIERLPYSALIFPNPDPAEQSRKPFVELKSNKDYSQIGIEAFLEENGVIKRTQYKDKYNQQNHSLVNNILNTENE